jgi:hypothetical protein
MVAVCVEVSRFFFFRWLFIAELFVEVNSSGGA